MIYDNVFEDKDGDLCFSGVKVKDIAEKYGTPCYVLDEDGIAKRCRQYRTAMEESFGDNFSLLFASKALCIKGIYPIVRQEGFGADVVSVGEIYTAKKGGLDLENVYFHGNNKTDSDIEYAIDNGVGCFVSEGVEEIERIDEIAREKGTVQKILLRLSPGINPHTHVKITTGNVDSKFGLSVFDGQALEITKLALQKKNLELLGFHAHVGSQIFDVSTYLDCVDVMTEFIKRVKDETGFTAKILNLGGGFGVKYVEEDGEISYPSFISEIAERLKMDCERLEIGLPRIQLEPGRSIVADNGITVYTVGGVKEISGIRNYVSVDGGMADNIRYALYSSAYTVLNASKLKKKADYTCTVAGRCCESGDIIQENVKMQKPERGDLLVVLTTGAYNYTMSSNYNGLTRPPVIGIKGGKSEIMVERESLEDLLKNQK